MATAQHSSVAIANVIALPHTAWQSPRALRAPLTAHTLLRLAGGYGWSSGLREAPAVSPLLLMACCTLSSGTNLITALSRCALTCSNVRWPGGMLFRVSEDLDTRQSKPHSPWLSGSAAPCGHIDASQSAAMRSRVTPRAGAVKQLKRVPATLAAGPSPKPASSHQRRGMAAMPRADGLLSAQQPSTQPAKESLLPKP